MTHSTEHFVFIWKPLLKSEFFNLGLILTRQTADLASPSPPKRSLNRDGTSPRGRERGPSSPGTRKSPGCARRAPRLWLRLSLLFGARTAEGERPVGRLEVAVCRCR